MPTRQAFLLIGAALLGSGPPAAAAPRSFTVVIDAMKFGPVPAGLHKGDTIVWVNKDLFQHTATASDGSFDAIVPPGGRARTVLNRRGEVAFVCRYHPGMRGKLRIR